MYTIKIGVKQGNGGFLERRVADGGRVRLAQGERLVLFAEPENVDVKFDTHGEYTVRMKGGGEFVVASAAFMPEPGMTGPEAKASMLVFAPQVALEMGMRTSANLCPSTRPAWPIPAFFVAMSAKISASISFSKWLPSPPSPGKACPPGKIPSFRSGRCRL
jgi:hypothetical protein